MRYITLPPANRGQWIMGLFFIALGVFLAALVLIAVLQGRSPAFERDPWIIFLLLGFGALARGLWHWRATELAQRLINAGDLLLGGDILLKFLIAPHLLTSLGPQQIWLYDLAVACAAWCYAGAVLRGRHVV